MSSIWLLLSSDKLIKAAGLSKTSPSGNHESQHETAAITVHNETNNITNIVVAAAVAETTPPATAAQLVAAE